MVERGLDGCVTVEGWEWLRQQVAQGDGWIVDRVLMGVLSCDC